MARDFNGTTDLIACGTAAGLGTGAFTLSAWVYADTQGESNIGCIASRFNGGTAKGWNFRYINTAQLRFVHTTSGSSVSRATADNALPTGAWAHVLLTWDGSKTGANIHIYVNGTEPSYSATDNGTAVITDTSATAFRIGNDSAAAMTWDGRIAEVGVWNAVLSATEIATLRYVSPRLVRSASLQAYWPLYGVGTAEPDYSGNANAGTLTGTAAADHAPVGPLVLGCYGWQGNIAGPPPPPSTNPGWSGGGWW